MPNKYPLANMSLGTQLTALSAMVRRLSQRLDALEGKGPEPVKPPPPLNIDLPAAAYDEREGRAIVLSLIEIVCADLGLSKADLLHSKTRYCARARQWVYFEACEKGVSTPVIGHVIDRDHTTVMWGRDAEAKRRAAKAEVTCVFVSRRRVA